ncbi:MAG: phosphoribosylglycinamide synthetase C domain-containing protein [Candidatus Aenigmatarchaeota archaeon]
MKVLLVGDGAREHILAEQLARSSEVYAIMARRNPGIENIAQKAFISDFSNIEAIGAWVLKEKADLALVTSETALAKGVADALADMGIQLASPLSAGSAIGENTVYALNLMASAGIERPEPIVCKSEAELKNTVKRLGRVVMKPAIRIEWKGRRFSDSDFKKKTDMVRQGRSLIKRHGSLVVEEAVDGEGFSVQAITDGNALSVMPPVHVARRAFEGSEGELTEGMGSYSGGRLLPFITQDDFNYAKDCLERLIATMKAKGIEYRGPICGHFIAARKKPVMVDVLPTFGNMEVLNNLMLLKTQLAEVLASVAEGQLKPMSFLEKATVVKYLVPEGYPGTSRTKSQVAVDERVLWNNGAKAYVESLELKKSRVVTTSERTLAICAGGETIEEAEAKAEAAAAAVSGRLRHRRDIANSEYLNRQIKHMAMLRAV